ncbi:glycoside hydrolase family 78 protein [Prevotella sp. 10(H)]|uniref:glycoside hydrolase family 78 protein n=1 Tax=Prevotella sp. 10(H) TaxID=1158294 RepID=UPI001E3EE79A|nr:glycoside hydrolase family 78 protein [Prevotella sp. 10(H)]
MEEALGIDVQNPRIMWKINSKSPFKQDECRLLVASSKENVMKGKADIWDSGKIKTEDQLVYYEGNRLKSHTRYWVMVEVISGNKTIKSQPTWFETGKMSLTDWNASWITDDHNSDYEPSPMFRKDFTVNKNIASARYYISGLGYYELFLNGEKIGNNLLDPGFTDYGKRVLYSTYDVTKAIKKGKNAAGIQLGNGWYNEQTPTVWNFHQAPWKDRPRLICELLITYTDGTQEKILSDNSWKTSTGPYLFDNIHVGVTYDARKEQKGWNTAGFNDSAWKNAKLTTSPAPLVEAMKMPAISFSDLVTPVSVTQKNDTTYIVDMGINFAGVCSLKIKGPAGASVKLRHAEMLDKEGNIDQQNINMHLRPRNSREVIQTDIYTLKGQGIEEFFPQFTYHGFRYIEVTLSEPMVIDKNTLTGVVMHSNVDKIGSFECSNELLNKINEICNRSYLSNLFGIPTDCPTREKNGWMADGFMVQEAGMFTYDSRNVYAKWVRDMIDAQEENGNVPGIVPTSWKWDSNWAGPIWDAAIFIVPYTLYQYTGDIETIREIYPTAERYMKYIETREDERGLINHGLNDWLFYKAETPVDFMTTSYVYWNNIVMAKMSELIGRSDQKQKYLDKAAVLKKRINDNFFDTKTVSYSNKTQLAYALPLYFDIVPAEYKDRLAENLREKMKETDGNLDFGFIGSVMVPDALSETGNTDAAFRMATKTTLPSWGYWIKETDATSLYETWDVTRRIGDASLNHPSMGAINAWMYKYLAGINLDPAEPAFKKIIIKPSFVQGLDWVKASHDSQQGVIKSEWKREGNKVTLKVTIPATSTASIILPGETTKEVKGGEHVFTINQ